MLFYEWSVLDGLLSLTFFHNIDNKHTQNNNNICYLKKTWLDQSFDVHPTCLLRLSNVCDGIFSHVCGHPRPCGVSCVCERGEKTSHVCVYTCVVALSKTAVPAPRHGFYLWTHLATLVMSLLMLSLLVWPHDSFMPSELWCNYEVTGGREFIHKVDREFGS